MPSILVLDICRFPCSYKYGKDKLSYFAVLCASYKPENVRRGSERSGENKCVLDVVVSVFVCNETLEILTDINPFSELYSVYPLSLLLLLTSEQRTTEVSNMHVEMPTYVNDTYEWHSFQLTLHYIMLRGECTCHEEELPFINCYLRSILFPTNDSLIADSGLDADEKNRLPIPVFDRLRKS